MSPKLRAQGSELHGPPMPRWPITSDLRQEPGALAAHAGICAGRGLTRPLPRPFITLIFEVRHFKKSEQSPQRRRNVFVLAQ